MPRTNNISSVNVDVNFTQEARCRNLLGIIYRSTVKHYCHEQILEHNITDDNWLSAAIFFVSVILVFFVYRKCIEHFQIEYTFRRSLVASVIVLLIIPRFRVFSKPLRFDFLDPGYISCPH